jgi:hypothetical protein
MACLDGFEEDRMSAEHSEGCSTLLTRLRHWVGGLLLGPVLPHPAKENCAKGQEAASSQAINETMACPGLDTPEL